MLFVTLLYWLRKHTWNPKESFFFSFPSVLLCLQTILREAKGCVVRLPVTPRPAQELRLYCPPFKVMPGGRSSHPAVNHSPGPLSLPQHLVTKWSCVIFHNWSAEASGLFNSVAQQCYQGLVLFHWLCSIALVCYHSVISTLRLEEDGWGSSKSHMQA